MALTLLFRNPQKTKLTQYGSSGEEILAFTLDCTLRENHEYANDLTEFPVESGYNISDHVIHHPEAVTIEGMITNTPIAIGAMIEDRRVDSFRAFLKMCGYRLPEDETAGLVAPRVVQLVTGLRVYNNMLLVRFSVPRDNKNTNMLRFSADFKRLVTVKTQYTTISNTSNLNGKAANTDKKAPEKKDKGKVEGKKPEKKSTSILKNIFSVLGVK